MGGKFFRDWLGMVKFYLLFLLMDGEKVGRNESEM